VHPADLPGINDEVARCIAARGPFSREFRVVWPDASVHWVVGLGEFIYDASGKAVRMRGMVYDITARKQAELELKHLNASLELRVAGRTTELAQANARLTAEITERAALQEELVLASERERERLGRNLHDGLCQMLTAARYKTDSLLSRVEAGSPLGEKVRSIAGLVSQAVDEARGLARGLEPVAPLPEGLMVALQQLASATSRLFNVSCECEFPQPVLIADHQAAVELFRVAQEATHNGIKHGLASMIRIRLVAETEETVLTVTNNGRPISRPPPTEGMGLKTMRYRSERISTRLTIEPGAESGTVVCCRLRRTPPGPGKEEPSE
jgi:signal transduction histidine kinase